MYSDEIGLEVWDSQKIRVGIMLHLADCKLGLARLYLAKAEDRGRKAEGKGDPNVEFMLNINKSDTTHSRPLNFLECSNCVATLKKPSLFCPGQMLTAPGTRQIFAQLFRESGKE